MQLVENAAPGVIKQAQMCKFANTSCGGFEAVASRGYLWVTVMNTGYAAAQYTITVRKAIASIKIMNTGYAAAQYTITVGELIGLWK